MRLEPPARERRTILKRRRSRARDAAPIRTGGRRSCSGSWRARPFLYAGPIAVTATAPVSRAASALATRKVRATATSGFNEMEPRVHPYFLSTAPEQRHSVRRVLALANDPRTSHAHVHLLLNDLVSHTDVDQPPHVRDVFELAPSGETSSCAEHASQPVPPPRSQPTTPQGTRSRERRQRPGRLMYAPGSDADETSPP